MADVIASLRADTDVEAATRAALERIAELDPAIRAWEYLDPESAIARARELKRGSRRGPLHGVLLGAKDIFDTFDMPTGYGSPIYAGHRPAADASCVALARAKGALVLGKTVTTEFAAFPPGPTTNPHNARHTPGGSSSGSAAAVAAGMVQAAFGTQTSGSIIRPAAFCGVVGYKPSFGLLPRAGVKMVSDSLDTVGLLARSVAEAAWVAGALAERPLELPTAPPAPRLAVCLTPQWPLAAPETQALFEDLPVRLAPARLASLELPAAFERLADAQNTIWTYEMARCLADEHRRHRDLIREPLLAMLDAGAAIDAAAYDEALALADVCRAQLPALLDGLDALIVPSAPGEAPAGLEATGDPAFNRIWTVLHTPAVNVPAGTGPNGLPLGVQVVGRPGDDAGVLACAAWVECRLATSP
jgi:Asp-tRNA(Asn)/Glu-tRNA(Gln) amidotransferase A subunit family amidase